MYLDRKNKLKNGCDFYSSADRPKWSALDNRMLRCTVGNDVRDWKDALACFFAHWDGDNGMKD